jgi:hypothetical protein
MKQSVSLFFATVVFSVLFACSAHAGETVDLLDGEKLRPGAKWVIEEGVMRPADKPGGFVWTKDAYGDFEISLEYKTSKKCNSGLFFRADPKNPVQGGFEVQIASDGLYDGKHVVGALYAAKEPAVNAGKPDGEWNKMTLRCQGPKIHCVLNGKTVLDLNLDDWDTAQKNPDGSKNKFKKALKDLPRSGHLGFQYHGHPVWYRNVTITSLAAAK